MMVLDPLCGSCRARPSNMAQRPLSLTRILLGRKTMAAVDMT